MQIRSYLTVAFLLISVPQANAQTTGVDNPVCNPQFAQILVEQQVAESKSVVEPVKRIKILIRSADFLWKLDQPVARGYFTEAYKIAADRFKETGFETKKGTGSAAGLTTILPDQRGEVLRAIAARDPEWAKRLYEQMLAEYEKSAADRGVNDKTREIGDLLSLAGQTVKTNPEFSRSLFRRVMKYPLVYNWFFAFYAVAADDIPFADSLYAEVLRNYQNEMPRRLLFLSAYPFANERMFGFDKFTLGTSLPANLSANPALQRQFLGVFFTRIANFAASADEINRPAEPNYQPEPTYMVSALNDIEPIIIERFPDLLQRFSVARTQANSLINETMRKDLAEKEKHTTELGSSFDERLAALEKADADGKLTDFMIVNLVTWTKKTEEQFVKLATWLDKIKDEKVRRETINYFWFLRSKLAIKEKRFDDAEKFALKVPEIDHRAVLMFEMAGEQLKDQNDAPNVFDTLNSISKLARNADNSVAKAQILLGLSTMYDKVNHSVAIDELSEAVRVINGLKDPDIFAGALHRQISGKEFSFFAMFELPGYNLEKTFEEISKKDFELSLANARALDDKYFRTLAVIAIANNCAKNTKPVAKPPVKPKIAGL